MRERKREKQQLEKLGTLAPIVSTSTEATSIPVSHQNVIKFEIKNPLIKSNLKIFGLKFKL